MSRWCNYSPSPYRKLKKNHHENKKESFCEVKSKKGMEQEIDFLAARYKVWNWTIRAHDEHTCGAVIITVYTL